MVGNITANVLYLYLVADFENENNEQPQDPQLNTCAVIHRLHKWDTPKHPISATCVRCGCKRIAEKFSSGMGWIYIEKGKVAELTSAPACV